MERKLEDRVRDLESTVKNLLERVSRLEEPPEDGLTDSGEFDSEEDDNMDDDLDQELSEDESEEDGDRSTKRKGKN